MTRGRAPPLAERPVGRLRAGELARLRHALAQSPRRFQIAADRWSPARVGRLIRTRFHRPWSNAHAVRTLRKQGVVLIFTRARESRLSVSRRATLIRLLRGTPAQAHLPGESWSRALIAQLLERRFHIRYSPQHVGRIVRSLRLRCRLRTRSRRRLSTSQARQLRRLLCRSPAACGQAGRCWTRRQVATVIETHFGVHYRPRSIARVLGRWRIGVVLAPDPHPTRLSAEQACDLSQWLMQTPHQLGLEGNIWTQRRIAQLVEQRLGVRYRAHNIYRALKRWGVTLEQAPRRGGLERLNRTQLEELARALQASPAEHGLTGTRWTRALLRQFVAERFHVQYAASSMSRWLRYEVPSEQSDQTSGQAPGSVASAGAPRPIELGVSLRIPDHNPSLESVPG